VGGDVSAARAGVAASMASRMPLLAASPAPQPVDAGQFAQISRILIG